MKQYTKQMLMIFIATVTLLTSLAGLFMLNNSLAWLAYNQDVSGKGLTVSAKVSPNLIIGKTPAELTQANILFTVEFSEAENTEMVAVTHDETVEGTYLKYLTNHYAVDAESGNVIDGMNLEFEPVTADDEAYFVDYTVYIASAFKPLAISSLTAEILAPASTGNANPHIYAASIDFYLEEVSEEGYLGTTSVADSVFGTERAYIEIFSDGTVPLANEGYLTVIMRCYFDGALQNPQTNGAYINSATAKTNNVALGVRFTATEATAQ